MITTKEIWRATSEEAISPIDGEPVDAYQALLLLADVRTETTDAPLSDIAACHAAARPSSGSVAAWQGWAAQWDWADRIKAWERKRISDSVSPFIDSEATIEASLERSQRALVDASERAIQQAIAIFGRAGPVRPEDLRAAAALLSTAYTITSAIDQRRGRIAKTIEKIHARLGVDPEDV